MQLLGGDADAIETLRPALGINTAKTVKVGGSGAGLAAKIANNMRRAANLVLVGEAIRSGQAAGVRPEEMLALCGDSRSKSWISPHLLR